MITIKPTSYFKFSAGEVQAELIDNSGLTEFKTILMKDYSMDGFMALAQYVEILKRSNLNISVVYPYFPYSRQDRSTGDSISFSLKRFTELLNSLGLYEVITFDPHSDVTPALINNCKVISQWEIAQKVIPKEYFNNKDVMFVAPDAGAYKKLSKLMPDDNRIIIGTKVRDVTTGEITATNVYSPVDFTGKTCIIVDDICDGGKTFIELAKVLKAKGASKVDLYVTHGIFSKGLPVLKVGGIDHIFTTDSFKDSFDYKRFEVEKELGKSLTILEISK